MTVRRVRYGLSDTEYRDAPGLSHSQTKQLRKSPYHFKRLSEPRPDDVGRAQTPQMFMGTLAHCALLEPEAFEDRYCVLPDLNKNSNAYKALADEAKARGLTPITEPQKEQAFGMAESVRKLPDVAALLGPGYAAEVSIWWTDPITGVLCKGRLDLLRRLDTPEHEHGSLGVLDLKTTETATADHFSKSILDYGYHTQQDWYSSGVEIVMQLPVSAFILAVVEREFPYAARSFKIDAQALAIAREINDDVRALYARCKTTDQWPGYPEDTEEIGLPDWFIRRYSKGEV